jgi:hypothetical protein
MLSRQLLRKLLNEILEEQGVKLRTSKGYGASHPVVSRKPLTGYGDMYQFKEEPKKIMKNKKKKVDVSKAFDEEYLEDIEEYERVIKEILNGK